MDSRTTEKISAEISKGNGRKKFPTKRLKRIWRPWMSTSPTCRMPWIKMLKKSNAPKGSASCVTSKAT